MCVHAQCSLLNLLPSSTWQAEFYTAANNVQMVLDKGAICWRPDLGAGDNDDIGVLRMFAQWSKRYLDTGNLMKRLDVGEGSYGREIEEDYDVQHSMSELQQVRTS
jgi:dynein heavy chain, axonemal